ncbi:hypothetical protein KQ945_14050 [Bacillus subtilis subsp. subtilis]|nr:hypothetical protein [Bacillus subtilis subsp. subtilis]
MSTHCLLLLLSLASSCALPWSPVRIHLSIPPQADLCVQYAAHAPVCLSTLIQTLEAQPLVWMAVANTGGKAD